MIATVNAREGDATSENIVLSVTARFGSFYSNSRYAQSHLVISRSIRTRENRWVVDDSDGRREERTTVTAAVKRQVDIGGVGELNWDKARRPRPK